MKSENVFLKGVLGPRVDLRKTQGLFKTFAPEGVRCIQGHWIDPGRLRLKERDERGGEVARRPEGRKEAAAAMDSGGKVAGAGGLGASGHGFQFRMHRERGGQREPAHALYAAGERFERHALWPAAMELAGARG